MRQPYWEWGMWMYRASVAQANGAGGAIVMFFAPLQGSSMIVIDVRGSNSGTNTLQILRVDEDGNEGPFWSSIGSGLATVGTIPRGFTTLTTSDFIDTTDLLARMIRAGDTLRIQQTGAGAQNDTLIVEIRAFLSSAERPIVSKALSTNAGDVTIATPTVDMIR